MATYSGTPRTWSAGQTVTAALMNSDVRDPLAALAGAWTSFTPTLDQGVSTNIAKTTTYAKYIQVGKLVICQISLAITGAGTSGSWITATLPVTAVGSGLVVGVGRYVDASGSFYTATAYTTTSTKVALITDATTTTTSFKAIGEDPAIAVANGDAFQAFVLYEAA